MLENKIIMGSASDANNELDLNTKLIRDSSQEFSMIDEEIVMLSLKNGEYYALNAIATRIWEELEKEIKIKDLLDKLLNEYDISFEQCKKDTLECLNDLTDKQLIFVK